MGKYAGSNEYIGELAVDKLCMANTICCGFGQYLDEAG